MENPVHTPPRKRGRRLARATQADIRRAVAAVVESGYRMMVEILPSGVIRLIPTAEQAIENIEDSTPKGGIVL